MTARTIWISYDLGVRGDYEGLYVWLDAHEAQECGDSVAVLKYDGAVPEKLKAELKKAVAIDKRTRIYVIYREPATDMNKGKFIFGGRRAAAWTGFAQADASVTDDES